jgi:hypothetical protein
MLITPPLALATPLARPPAASAGPASDQTGEP